jgi:16S rRNA (guanine527-N7)-methyltransferase
MTALEARTLRAGAKRFGVELEAEEIGRVGTFLSLLAVWNPRVRLTADRDLGPVIDKHAVDSLSPVPHLPATGLVVDVGSGAGFPGIMIACVRPDVELVLLEARRRRASFLREVVRTIPLPKVRVLELRAEEAAGDRTLARSAALVIARGVRLDAFLALAAPLVADAGEVIAMQTPRTAVMAEAAAKPHGLRLSRRHDYTLGGGESRTLLVFNRAAGPRGPVP